MRLNQIMSLGLISLAACSSANSTSPNGNAVGTCQATPGAACVASVPLCDASHLNPFIPSGTAMRVAQIPAGSYNYIGGDVYAESTNLNPNAKIAVSDTDPTNPAYPGTLVCLTNLGSQVPTFNTNGATVRGIQRTPSPDQFAFSGLRNLSATFQGGTLQTLISSQNKFEIKTPMEVEQEQQTREAQGWSINAYQVSANEYKFVVIRPISSGGTTLNLFVAARYTRN